MAQTSGYPARQVAILTCMDARVDPLRAMGLQLGDAHVLRNAGAMASDDALRSLLLSQQLGTRAVAVIAHSDCALGKLDEGELVARLEGQAGQAPPFRFGAFVDLDGHVRDQVDRVRACPWLEHVDDVRGYVLELKDGALRQVV